MIKMSISSAKRLGFSIKGYVFDNSSKVPIPVLKKAKRKVKRKKRSKKSRIELIEEGVICKLNLKDNNECL